MSMPASGSIKFSDLQSIFGGVPPISLSEYYANSTPGYTSGVSGIVNSGNPFKFSLFYGKSPFVGGGGGGGVSSSVANPYNETTITVLSTTSGAGTNNLPIVSYGGAEWYLQHNFGSAGRWSGLELRNWSNATITIGDNYTVPSSIREIKTDWTSQNIGSYGIGGYKDAVTDGTNSIYLSHTAIFATTTTVISSTLGILTGNNQRASSSMMTYIPSWTTQVCLVAADYYRSQGTSQRRNSYWYSSNGTSW
jgi:hypothetical protein